MCNASVCNFDERRDKPGTNLAKALKRLNGCNAGKIIRKYRRLNVHRAMVHFLTYCDG